MTLKVDCILEYNISHHVAEGGIGQTNLWRALVTHSELDLPPLFDITVSAYAPKVARALLESALRAIGAEANWRKDLEDKDVDEPRCPACIKPLAGMTTDMYYTGLDKNDHSCPICGATRRSWECGRGDVASLSKELQLREVLAK